jgi:hypothetical protein
LHPRRYYLFAFDPAVDALGSYDVGSDEHGEFEFKPSPIDEIMVKLLISLHVRSAGPSGALRSRLERPLRKVSKNQIWLSVWTDRASVCLL